MSLEQQKQAIIQLEETGQLPKLDRTDSLTGIDQDQNGVRDDIDAYINQLSIEKSLDKDQEKSLIQLSRSLQIVLEHENLTTEIAKLISEKQSKAMHCVFNKIKDRAVMKDPIQPFESWTFNTKKRLIHYIGYNRILNGTSSSMTSGDTCE